jgi:hypothetical protein
MTAQVGVGDHLGPSVGLLGRTYPVLLPRRSDPRLVVAAIIISVQILGQTVLGFNLSIAQILISLGVAGGLDLVLTAWERGVIVWPASALLTGNGVALIMRVPGTEHGDWWSTRGWPIFAATAAVAVLSKYVTRIGGRPLLNPSNAALVVAFLVFGSGLADPQDLWWGPWSPGLALTYAVIVIGGLAMTRRLRLHRIVWPFLITYGAATAVVAATGHSMTARWHVGPVTGWAWWWVVVASPELLIFLFFMITDPPTAAKGRVGGAVYGVAVALTAAALMAAQGTEFATKVALLGALTLVCASRPLIERFAPEPGGDGDTLRSAARHIARRVSPAHPRPALAGLAAVALVGGATLLVGAGTGQRQTPAGIDVERPDVAALVGDLPEVSLDPAVAEVIPGFDRARAEALVADLAADLMIEAEAIDAGEAAALPSALTGPRLAAATAVLDPSALGDAAPSNASPSTSEQADTGQPGAGQPGAEPVAPEADPDQGVPPTPGQRVTLGEAEVTIVRTSDSPQALPSLGVIAGGTVDDATSGGAAFTSAFVMAAPVDDWLLVDVLDPDALPGG